MPLIKLNFKWIKDINVKDTIFTKKLEEYLYNHVVGETFKSNKGNIQEKIKRFNYKEI